MDTRLWLLTAIVVLAACSTPQSRIDKHRDVFDSAPPEVQKSIQAGQVDAGMTPAEVELALGKPDRKETRKQAGAADQEIWVYHPVRAHPGVDVGVGVGSYSGGGPAATSMTLGTESVGHYDDPSTQVVFENGRVLSVVQSR